MQYMRIFSKKEDDYVRYWASVSTEKVDKDNKPTGEYMRANISVRLSAAALKVFDDNKIKTKTKGIKNLNVKMTDGWLKAYEPKEGQPFVYLFINTIEVIDESDDDD